MGHIFISYSTKDVERAEQLIEALKREGFNPWVDMEGLGAGTHWRTRLESQIESCDAYILIVSRNSKTSKWVKEELDLAQSLKKKIFPLRIDDTKPFFGIRTIQYEDIRKGRLPSESFYQRLALETPRQKVIRRRKTIRADKAKRQMMEGASQLFSHYSEELSNKGKDFITLASKKSSEVYKSVITSDTVKRLSASVKRNVTPEKKAVSDKKNKTTVKKRSTAKKRATPKQRNTSTSKRKAAQKNKK